MAKNPMQRKAQNSFLLGMLVTLLITGIIIAFLIMQLTKVTNEQKAEEKKITKVYVLAQDVNSGDSITEDLLVLKETLSTMIPRDALTPATLSEKTDIIDENGNLIKKVNVISKINLKAGTIVTTEMIAEDGELASDVRKVEYNMIDLPTQLQTNQYVDIRMQLPSGADFIVVSHKKIEIPKIDGIDSTSAIWLNVNETEILLLSCAIIETYKIEGTKLYATEYIEPGLQNAATTTYIPNNETIRLINDDPNCLAEAKQALANRTEKQESVEATRNPINSNLNQIEPEDAIDNVKTKVTEEIRKRQEERQKYLESLGGSY